MINKNREVCICNHVSAREVIDIIKENDIQTLEELLAQHITPVGDKCKSCHEEGYENDGFALAMLLSLVKQKRI